MVEVVVWSLQVRMTVKFSPLTACHVISKSVKRINKGQANIVSVSLFVRSLSGPSLSLVASKWTLHEEEGQTLFATIEMQHDEEKKNLLAASKRVPLENEQEDSSLGFHTRIRGGGGGGGRPPCRVSKEKGDGGSEILKMGVQRDEGGPPHHIILSVNVSRT